ncbi:MAG: energy transducer TonB [Gammaproteobacteria bacterium]|nr:energy transducer TonB [Gammaproteobacteria bacterium]
MQIYTGNSPRKPAVSTRPTASLDNNHPTEVIKYASPQYPERAIDRGVTGTVWLQFDIDTEGKPSNITVIKAEPEKVFDKAVITALEQWRFEPYVVNGIPTILTKKSMDFFFKLANDNINNNNPF